MAGMENQSLEPLPGHDWRILLTELRPIDKRRAISAGEQPLLNSRLTGSAFRKAVRGLP